jgi:hypothetical protein
MALEPLQVALRTAGEQMFGCGIGFRARRQNIRSPRKYAAPSRRALDDDFWYNASATRASASAIFKTAGREPLEKMNAARAQFRIGFCDVNRAAIADSAMPDSQDYP